MKTEIKLDVSLTAKNDKIAKEINEKLKEKALFCVNLMGAPGSGKTTLIEGLSPFLKIGVIQGDLKSDVDTKRLEKAGVKCIQINTHSGCHLNAQMIKDALENITFSDEEFLIIENVGNLVCPAGVLIGQDVNILASAVTEGNDKPEKYPLIFRDSEVIVITKYDLKEVVEFDEENYLNILGNKKFFRVSSKDNDSYKALADFLKELKEKKFS